MVHTENTLQKKRTLYTAVIIDGEIEKKNKEYYKNYYLRKKLEREQVTDDFGFLLLFKLN